MRYLRHALVTALLLAFLAVPAVAHARYVPYVVGVSGRYAVGVIHRSGYKAYVARRGVYSTRYARYRVVRQATRGGTVTITCSLGRPPKRPTYSWRTAVYSCYGGPSERQSVAGPYANTGYMDAHGIPYFAHKTMRFGTRVVFRDSGGRTIIAVCADRGPYVAGRVFDLGAPVWRKLHLGGTGRISWAYAK